MCCPCVNFKNNKDYSSSRILHSHIFANGFIEKYVYWTKHGERGITMEDNEEEDFDDHFPGNARDIEGEHPGREFLRRSCGIRL